MVDMEKGRMKKDGTEKREGEVKQDGEQKKGEEKDMKERNMEVMEEQTEKKEGVVEEEEKEEQLAENNTLDFVNASCSGKNLYLDYLLYNYLYYISLY